MMQQEEEDGEPSGPSWADKIFGGDTSPANFLRRLRFIALLAAAIVVIALIVKAL